MPNDKRYLPKDKDYSVTELLSVLKKLNDQQRDLGARLGDLKARLDSVTTPVTEQSELAYQQASDWLRMVNTITWALSSIFLVGAIIALNGASQNGVLPLWRLAAYILVMILCAVWWRVDWVYTQSANQLARSSSPLSEAGMERTHCIQPRTMIRG